MADLSGAFTPERWEYIVNHAEDTLVPDILAVGIIGAVFSTAFVVMRLWSRRLVHKRFKLDGSDWLCIVALIFTLGLIITVCVGTRYGAGRHIIKVPDLRSLYIILLIANGFHPAAMGPLKLSILFLYHSIFPSRHFRWVCWAVGIFTTLWTIAALVAGVALCIPIEKLWDPTITHGTCIPLAPIGVAITSSHIATDFIILLMPVPLVLRLKTSRKKKLLVTLTFVVGGAACVVSIARLPVWMGIESNPNIGWEQIPSAMLAIAECTVGLLAACFPLYRPLIHLITGKDKKSQKNISGSDSCNKSISASRTGKGAELGMMSHGSVAANVSSDASAARPSRGIAVTDEIELIRHASPDHGWSEVSDEASEDLFKASAPWPAKMR